MKKYELSIKDYDWLKKIINISISIKNLYDNLIKLEVLGNKNTDEYLKYLNYLDIGIEIEDKIYKEANLNFSKSDALAGFLNGFLVEKNLNKNVLARDLDINNKNILPKDLDIVLMRIISVLVYNCISDYQSIQKMSNNDLKELKETFGIKNLVGLSIYSGIELKKSLDKDSNMGFLTFLQEFIKDNNYSSFKEDLIEYKYYNIFMNKNVENYIKENHFEIPKFYTNSRFIADLTRTDLYLYQLFKNNYANRIAMESILNILEISDSDYMKTNESIFSILNQCYLRSSLLQMDDDYISDSNYAFHEFVEGKEYNKNYPEHNISEQIIISCFKGIKKDREKQFEVSIRYRKK